MGGGPVRIMLRTRYLTKSPHTTRHILSAARDCARKARERIGKTAEVLDQSRAQPLFYHRTTKGS